MARNRKRAKERRPRRPAGAPIAATARIDRDETPDAIEHAAPDVELAEAQLALGRPELAGQDEPEDPDESADAELERDEELEAEALDAGEAVNGADTGALPSESGSGAALPARRERQLPATRLITFLQGSWRELQRVQWPDRRQVMQATGVVIGFVIVAGVFLGVSDTLAGKLMNFILK